MLLLLLTLAGSARAGNYFQGVSPSSVVWPGGIIPYRFDTNYIVTAVESNAILAGLREWELAANIKFVPFTTQTNYVLLQFLNDGSGSGFCHLGNPATIMLHGLARGLMCHEGGHLLGLQHEHQRTDRDNYIVVNTANVLGGTNVDGSIGEFLIDTNSTAFGYYDFQSVMHYGADTFTNGLGDSLDPLAPYQKYFHKLGNLALSIEDRATVSNLYGARLVPLGNVVTNSADGGSGSLRAAIYYANDHPGTTINFNIPNTDPGYSNGVFNIHLIGELPPLVSAGTVIDGSTQPGYPGHPIIALDGSLVSPEAGPVSGLHLYGTNCTVRALAIDNFSASGIQLFCSDAVSNHVQGCYLGLGPGGTNAAPDNYAGIFFEFGAHNNVAGGTNAAQRNVISGNLQYGLLINDANSDNNIIIGNYIGLDASGSYAVSNGFSGIGIWDGPVGTIIGGTNNGDRNVISANHYDGVSLSYSNISGAVIQGNYIGTDYTGGKAVPNGQSGVDIFAGAHGMVIGGTSATARNIISGNGYTGIIINGTGVTNNVVQGNYVGIDSTGSNAVPNASFGIGIWGGATANLIGGTNSGTANVASGNGTYGILIADTGTSNNVVQGNFAGTEPTGHTAVPNGGTGITIENGATGNMVGGTNAGAANVASGNTGDGILVTDTGTTGNTVQGNLAGTDPTGKIAVANGNSGIRVDNNASSNLVGGTTSAAANIASGNNYTGIIVSSPGAINNLIQGNLIGTDITGKLALPNTTFGLGVWNGASGNFIGGATKSAANVISGNGSYGVLIADRGAHGNQIQGNLIGTDITGKIALANGFAGLAIWDTAASNIIGGTVTGAGNVISGNGTYGLYISDADTKANVFEGNLIGTDGSGTNALGNGFAGVYLQNGATANVIGGTETGAANIIAFSSAGPGAVVVGASTTNNSFRENSIFGNAAIGIDLNNDGVTANHAGFLAGPNDLQNYPVITSAYGYEGNTIVAGTLSSLPGKIFYIDIYANAAPGLSGHGQGKYYLGSVTVLTDGSGNASYSLTNTLENDAGEYISATATSAGGDTSEFATDLLATNLPVPFAQFVSGQAWKAGGFVMNLSVTTNFSYRIQATTNLAGSPIPWIDLTNFTPQVTSVLFTDRMATNFRSRYYRAVSP